MFVGQTIFRHIRGLSPTIWGPSLLHDRTLLGDCLIRINNLMASCLTIIQISPVIAIFEINRKSYVSNLHVTNNDDQTARRPNILRLIIGRLIQANPKSSMARGRSVDENGQKPKEN